MRIALVSREVSPFFGAGIGSYAAAMARAWSGQGHEVHFVSESHPGFLDRGPESLGGAVCHAAGAELAPEFETSFPFVRHAMRVYRCLKMLHARHAFDYIEFPEYWAEGYFAIRAKRTMGEFAGATLGVRLHTPTHECRALNNEALLDDEVAALEHCEEEAMREADVIISPTRSLLEMLTRRVGLNNPSFVVPYPFEKLPAEGAIVPTPRPTLMYFGRMERRKGVHLLIEAVQQLLDRGLSFDTRLIGGDTNTGPSGSSMRAHLRSLIDSRHADRIHLENPVPRRELPRTIASVSAGGGACCFPSLWENFPNTCLEAMSIGCPVIGSDAGGMSEIIEDGQCGLLFKSGDVASLRDAIERMMTDATLRNAIAHAGPARIAEMCNPAAIVDETIAAIKQVQPKPAPRAAAHPAVSIIIPHYNLGAYLPETLDSVRAQTVKDVEVIVVDDGSTDSDVPALLERVERGDFGTVRVIRKRNGGLSSARNAGIAEAKSEWIVPLDADDLLHPEFLARTLDAAARDDGLSLVSTLVSYFDEGGPRDAAVPLGFARDLLATTNCASTCTALIRKRDIEQLGGYDTSLRSFEDWDLYCRMAMAGMRATVIPEPLFRYRMRSNSMMRTAGESRRAAFASQILARYPHLAVHPDRAMRILASRVEGSSGAAAAQRMIRDNVRYQIADRVNIALKRTGIQGAVKGLAQRILGKPHS